MLGNAGLNVKCWGNKKVRLSFKMCFGTTGYLKTCEKFFFFAFKPMISRQTLKVKRKITFSTVCVTNHTGSAHVASS